MAMTTELLPGDKVSVFLLPTDLDPTDATLALPMIVGYIERLDEPGENEAEYFDGVEPAITTSWNQMHEGYSDLAGVVTLDLRVGWERLWLIQCP